MKKKIILIGIVFIITFICVAYIWIFPTPENFVFNNGDKPILIAHAGGKIQDKIYTNSIEAVQQAILNKYDFIELDLEVLKDNNIGLIHDVDHFNEMTGNDYTEIQSLSLDDLKKTVSEDALHPISIEEINQLFLKKNIFLVTDKIHDLDLLNEKITLDKDKMLVELASYRSYSEALRKGYKYPMLSIYKKADLDKFRIFFSLGKIKIIAIPIRLITSCGEELKELKKKGIAIFAFTSNEKTFILDKGKDIVTGFYTDEITKQDLLY